MPLTASLFTGLSLLVCLAIGAVTYWFWRTKCFIRNISSAQKALLSSANIWHKASGASGILVNESDLEQACAALGSYLLTKFRPGRFGITEAVIQVERADPALDRYLVQLATQLTTQEHDTLVVRLVREIILPAVRCDITVNNGYGRRLIPESPRFNVVLDCTDSPVRGAGQARQPVPTSIAGYRLNVRRNVVWGPSANGILLVEPESGFVFGEIIDNSLYLFLPIEAGNGPLLAVLAQLLERSARELNIDAMIDEWLLTRPDVELPAPVEKGPGARKPLSRRDKIIEKLVNRVLVPGIGKSVRLVDERGSQCSSVRMQNGILQVHYHATPIGLSHVNSLPTGLGIPIVIGADELVGEFLPDNLFIYGDVIADGVRAEVYRLAEILLSARHQIVAGDNRDLQAEFLVGECMTLIRSCVTPTAPAAQSVGAADENLLTRIRAAREFEFEQLRLDQYPEHLLGQEFDSILQLEQVRDVRVTVDELVVETDMLYATDDRTGRLHKIGQFDIHIPFGGRPGIRFINKTRLVMGRHAPHVYDDGRPCLGSIRELLPELIARREFAEAVQVAIAFLESVNTRDSYGKQVNEWPVERFGRAPRGDRNGIHRFT